MLSAVAVLSAASVVSEAAVLSAASVAVVSADMSGSMHSYPTELYSACCSISAASASAAVSVCLAAYFCCLRSLIFINIKNCS